MRKLRAEQRVEEAVEERRFAEPQAAQGYAYYEEAFRQRF